jgi:hypothetical protein
MALDAQQQQDYSDFLRRFQENPNSISSEEIARRYHELIGLVSPEEVAEAHKQAFVALAPDNRHALAQQFQDAHNDPNSAFDGYRFDDADQAAQPRSLGLMSFQAGQQDQSLLGRLFNSPLGKMAMAAMVAYLARRILGGQQNTNAQGQQPGGGLDIGAILGALGAAQGGSQSAGGQTGAGGLDIGAILGALANAQGGGTQGGSQSAGGQTGAGGLDIGAILGALANAQGGGAQGGQSGGGQAGTPPVGGQPDLSGLLSGQADNSELGKILTSLGGAQGKNLVPPQDQDDQPDTKS